MSVVMAKNAVAPVTKAVIPVAGLGTRFLPVTKALPKELLPIINKPVIHYIVEEVVAAGIKQIIFVTSENKIAVEAYFDKDTALECILQERRKLPELAAVQGPAQLAEFIYVHQKVPLGLGHAVLQAKEIIGDEPFLVVSGDDIVEAVVPAAKQLINAYNERAASILGVISVPSAHLKNYGIISPSEQITPTLCKVADIIEKPSPETAPSSLGVGGRWLLTPSIFTYLEQTAPGAGNEIQLTDALRALLCDEPLYALTYDGVYHDCGNKLEYLKTVISFALVDPELGPEIKQYLKTKI